MPARHVRRRRGRGLIAAFGAAAGAVLILSGTSVTTSALAGPPVSRTVAEAPRATDSPLPLPEVRQATSDIGAGAPVTSSDRLVVAPAGDDLCSTPSFTAALARHDDASAIAAAGGASAFRTAVAAGTAPCVSLADPTHVWVVVDKQRPYAPIDYAPSPMGFPAGVRSLEGGTLRTDAAAALSRMAAAARQAGAGEIALESGYRSYRTQVTSYGNQVSARGTDQADLVSARPGYSEHQSGLAGDVVGCADACGTLDDLASSPQGAWVAAHAWQYGWIVRYEAGHTDVTGYLPEPWHLRYIGTDLAAAYHDGGYHSLEEFFGLPAAPDYAG
jgi:zinc D-Ala-D-Ala carboxypeptidase